MGWKSITKKLNPYLDKVKEFSKRAAEFTEDKVQQFTPLFIKTASEYDAFLTKKRTVLIGYDDSHDSISNTIRLHSTVWMTRAFMDIATLRFISINEYPELSRHAGLTGPLDMRVRLDDIETHHINDIAEVLAWWKSPIYEKSSKKITSKKPTPKKKSTTKKPTKATTKTKDPLLNSNK